MSICLNVFFSGRETREICAELKNIKPDTKIHLLLIYLGTYLDETWRYVHTDSVADIYVFDGTL